MGPLGQADVRPRIGGVSLPQFRIARVRQHLVHAAAGHHITAQEQGQQTITHLTHSARRPATRRNRKPALRCPAHSPQRASEVPGRSGSTRHPATLRTPAVCASLRSGSGPSPTPRDLLSLSRAGRHRQAHRGTAWRGGLAAWYHWLVETGPVSFEVVPVDKPADMNVIIGQAHFIKTVEGLHEALAGVSRHLRFGLAFCEASAARLVRRSRQR